MIYSAGIIPYRFNKDGKIEFFLGHPGGQAWKDKNYWAYLKGGVEKNEDWLTAARREFEEECGVSLKEYKDEDFFPLGLTQQNKNKVVIAYALHFGNKDIDPAKCFSNMCEDNVTPEIDRYGWFDFDTVMKVTNKAHCVFYERIMSIFKRFG